MMQATFTQKATMNNPLFTKLRNRFASEGNRTIGDVMRAAAGIMQMPSLSSDIEHPAQANAERHITQANALPIDTSMPTKLFTPVPTTKKSRRLSTRFLVGAVCVVMLFAVVFSGVMINQLTHQIDDLKKQENAQLLEAEALSIAVAQKNDLAEIEALARGTYGLVDEGSVEHKSLSGSTGDSVLVVAKDDGGSILSNLTESFNDTLRK